MSIIGYDRNFYRAGADAPRLILPNDPVRAAQYRFDKTDIEIPEIDTPVGKLVHALARKNFDVPGITCEFDVLGEQDRPLHQLYRITGGVQGCKWKIELCRNIYRFDGRQVLSEASRINIPGAELELSEDGLHCYYPFVGDDWYEEEDAFIDMTKMDARENGDDRLYLRYEYHIGAFRHTTNQGMEYDREDDGPINYPAQEIYDKFDGFFEKLMARVEQTPDVTADPYEAWEKIAVVEPQQLPADFKPFYTIAKKTAGIDDGISIAGIVLYQGHDILFNCTPEMLENPAIPAAFNDGYQFGFPNAPYQSQSGLWGNDAAKKEYGLIKVDLKYANDIYVVDEKPILKSYAFLVAEACDQERDLNNEEKGHLHGMLAKTFVPLAKYKNDYECPMFLIGRPLWKDEAADVTDDIRGRMGKLQSPSEESYHTRLYRAMKNAL